MMNSPLSQDCIHKIYLQERKTEEKKKIMTISCQFKLQRSSENLNLNHHPIEE